MSIRIVVGEDSEIAREGILRFLEQEQEIEIVACCGDLESLRATVDETRPDVVLTDIRMPPDQTDEGIRLAVELRSSHPEVGVVVLSHYVEAAYAMQLLDDGSDRRGYLLKERVHEPDALSRALREVANGGSVVDSRIVEALLAAQRRRENSRLA